MVSEEDFSNHTVLIAEDNDSNYAYFKIGLKKTGIHILRAKDGFEAIQLCKENPEISIVIMDGMMPGMTGYTATKTIKEFRPELPIILVTAFFGSTSPHEALVNGCNDFLAKPISPDALRAIIHKWLHEK